MSNGQVPGDASVMQVPEGKLTSNSSERSNPVSRPRALSWVAGYVRIHPRSCPLLLALAAIAMTTIWGAAGPASASSETNQVINGCVEQGNRELHVYPASGTAKCPSGFIPVQWNVTGPPGSTGAPGSGGRTGPTGPPGEAIVYDEDEHATSPWDVLTSFAAVAAVLGGGLFTYYKFVKDRVYRARVGFGVRAGYLEIANQPFLKIEVSAKNLGQTRLQILTAQADRTSIVVSQERSIHLAPFRAVSWPDKKDSDLRTTPASEQAMISLFGLHEWFESGETLRDETVLRIDPSPDHVYRIRVILAVKKPGLILNRQFYMASIRNVRIPWIKTRQIEINTFRIIPFNQIVSTGLSFGVIPIEGEFTP